MQVSTCIRDIVNMRGVSLRNVSATLKRAPTWAANVSAPGRSPALATLTDIADVLEYDVAIIDRATGKVVGKIDPLHRQQ